MLSNMKLAAVLPLSLVSMLVSLAVAADTIPSSAAKDHINETATVCGKVSATRYLDSSAKRPTFLNFDKPYPNHTFTAVIMGENRSKFGAPEETYRDKDVCVTGKIVLFNEKPQIEITETNQIRVESK